MGVFFPQGGVAPQPAPAAVQPTVTIGCRIINGLTININVLNFSRQIKLNGPSGHGDIMTGNIDNHSFTSSQSPRGAFGTTVLLREEWDAIQRYYADAEWFQRGMVFKVN
jgi:hypothetical protein